MDPKNVKAVVTGGASGLGRATVTRIVSAGGRAAILDLASSTGADVAKTLGARVAFAPADVTNGPAGESALEAARSAMDGVDVPVNCAGIGTAAKTLGKRGPAELGIRVMTIAPGTFDTPLLATLPEPVRISLGKQVPFPPRLGRSEEYAALVLHVVENVMLNGETIRLDGAIRMSPR